MNCPFLEKLLLENALPYIDYALACHVLKEVPEANEAMACFLCHLSLAARQGHLCIRIENEKLIPSPKELWLEGELPLSDATFQQIAHLVSEGAQLLPLPLCQSVCHQNNSYYFQKNWTHESQFIEYVKGMQSTHPVLQCDLLAVRSCLEQMLADKKLLQEQASAIMQACEQRLTLICGGPGTGKTYTAAYLVKIFWECLPESQQQVCQIALAAPTGKAASNLQKSLGKLLSSIPGFKPTASKTLHALLGISAKREPLNADMVIIDESSMIDAKMMVNLFSALKPGARLVLLGDKDQLPPVEAGSLFADMVKVLTKPVQLTQCLRTDLQGIVELAQAINAGDHIRAEAMLNQNLGMGIKRFPLGPNLKTDLNNIVAYAASFFDYADDMEDEKLLGVFNQFRLLSPLRKGLFGVDEMNVRIKHYLTQLGRKRGLTAMPIMILNNDPRLEVFNGEVGVLVKHNPGAEVCQKGDFAIFPSVLENSSRKIPAVLLPKFEYAYCMSVHKSQGSEFDRVFLLLPEGSEQFGREVLYTAITRARKHIDIYTQGQVLQQTIVKQSFRLSGLS